MNLKILCLALLVIVNVFSKQWTVLMYADPCRSLTDAILKNINDLTNIDNIENADIYVQLRTYTSGDSNDCLAWRYKVENKRLVLEDCIKVTNDYVTDITQAAKWAYEKGSSEYYAFILSGHGHGILEPSWDPVNSAWTLEHDDAENMACEFRRTHRLECHRAVLMNDVSQAFVTNQEMCTVFKNVSNVINKKIDILAFDLCLGASLEHVFQLEPYVKYFVGCQTCELEDGFDFKALSKKLSKSCTSKELAKNIIKTYGDYYSIKAKKGIYTLSAINCKKSKQVANTLNEVVILLDQLIKKYPILKKDFLEARKKCTNFCFVPMYTDLFMLATEIQNVLQNIKEEKLAIEAYNLFEQLKKEIKNCILDCTSGKNIKAYGINIYYPYSHIDSSYYSVPFAQQTNWLRFLQSLVAA